MEIQSLVQAPKRRPVICWRCFSAPNSAGVGCVSLGSGVEAQHLSSGVQRAKDGQENQETEKIIKKFSRGQRRDGEPTAHINTQQKRQEHSRAQPVAGSPLLKAAHVS